MIEVFRLPDLGEGLTESEIVTWMVAEGDAVVLDQVLAEVETAKAAVELPSPYAGVIERLHVPAGSTVAVGSDLVASRVGNEALDEAVDEVVDEAVDEQDALVAPIVDEAQEPVAVPQEVVQRGPVDAFAQQAADPSAPPPNLVGYGAAAEGTTAPVRRPRRFAAPQVQPAAPLAAPRGPEPGPRQPGQRPLATPPVRKLAANLGVDLHHLAGSGPAGSVTRADVEEAGRSGAASSVPSLPADVPSDDGIERFAVRGVRKLTAAAMVASAAVPQVTVFTTVDVTATTELLDGQRDDDDRAPTFLAAVCRALCLAVARHRQVNARWDEAAQEIVQFRDVHLALAVAAPRGLLVPVLRDAQHEDLAGLARRIRELASTARAGHSTPAELSGGTITVSNVGVFGVDSGTPLLHDGQAAILAVGALAKRPWEWRGELALRSTVTLSLTVDHRVLDGEQGGRFLADIGRLLANPALAFVF